MEYKAVSSPVLMGVSNAEIPRRLSVLPGQVIGYKNDERVVALQFVDDFVAVHHGRGCSWSVGRVCWSFLVEAANFPDLLEGREDPGGGVLEFFDALVQPFHLLGLPVLRAAVVENLDVGGQGLVHDVQGYVVGVSQVPEKRQNLKVSRKTFQVWETFIKISISVSKIENNIKSSSFCSLDLCAVQIQEYVKFFQTFFYPSPRKVTSNA